MKNVHECKDKEKLMPGKIEILKNRTVPFSREFKKASSVMLVDARLKSKRFILLSSQRKSLIPSSLT